MLLLVIMAGIIGGVIVWIRGRHRAVSQNLGSSSDIILPDGGLLFRTKTGKLVAKLDADEGGGFLMIYNTSEKPAVVMGGSPYGGGGLIGLTTGKGAGAVLQLAGHEDGGSVVLLTRGKRGVELSTDDDGGTLSINGPTGDPAVTIATTQSGRKVSGKIDILESSGKVLWSAPPIARQK